MANSLGNAYVKIRADIGDLRSDLDKAMATIKSLESKVVDSNKNMQAAFDKVDKSIKNIVLSVLSFEAAKKAFDVGKELVDAGLAAEKLSTAMRSATGSYNSAQSAMSFLRQEAARLGTDLASGTDGFIKLTASAKGTSLEGEKTREIFTAISTAASALKLSNDEVSGSILAISQMMSKGTVQAEELRGQLGERLPGAFNLAAKAMGVTTAELDGMLRKGQVIASDFLPKLARVLTDEYGAAAEKSSDTTQAAVNRMNNSWAELKKTLGEDLLPTVVRVVEKLNSLIQMLTPDKFTGAARVTELQEKIANLQDRMTQPGMKWVLGDELVRAQTELKTLEYSMAGVTEKTGQWAKGMRDLSKSENDLLFNAKDGWQKYKEGVESAAKTSAYDQIKDKTLEVTKQTERLTEQLKNSETYQTILAAKGVEAADAWVKASVKSETHHEKASSAMKDAKKSAEEYKNAVNDVSDKYHQLTMSADEYAKLKVWEWYEKEAAVLGKNNEMLIASRDLQLKKIETDGEQAKAIKEVNDKYNELFLTTEQLEQVKLQDWFDKLKEKIKDNKEELEKLNLEFKAMRAKILYGNDKDTWVDFYKGKEEANERANKLIAEQDKASAKEVNKIWDKAWKNIESDFADSIYDMMDKGVDSFEDFFDKILDMFKKLLAEMIAAWVVSGLKTLLSGGEGAFSLAGLFGGGGDSSTGTASSALSLASLMKGISDLPETIASIPDKLISGLEAVGEALGLFGASTTASSAAASHAATSTAGAAVAMENLATSVNTATGTSVAAFEQLESSLAATSASANAAAAATGAGIAGIIALGAYVLPGLIGGGRDDIDMWGELRKWEAGWENITKETADFYKTELMGMADVWKDAMGEGALANRDWEKIDEWIANNQEFLKITVAEMEKLLSQQSEIAERTIDAVGVSTNAFLTAEAKANATIEVAIEMANDATTPIAQKMYQLGFIAKESGGWESEATMAMIAEFKNQGVAWEDINNALINYGATDADFYKRIYAEYHGDSVLTDLNTLTAALTADGVSEDVLKTIKYIYESNIPLDQMQALLEWAGLSSEEAARIVGQIDPSDEWKDLVIPVDAPESIPVDYKDMSGRASGGPVSAGVPYIIGEVGPELFVPQESGHILSNANMKKLMGMGVKGFADGTTDPFTQAGPTTGTENPAGDAGGSSDSSSTYSDISEWLKDYTEKLRELLGIGTDLGEQLFDLNEYYKEQYKYAQELGASDEQMLKMQQDQQAAKEKILQDWLDDEIDYYNKAMGLNTELGDTLKELSDHYKNAIEEAKDAGATQEQLAELEKAAQQVKEKALQDWLDGEKDYYNEMMGLNTELGDTLSGISDHYKNAIAEAQAAGATEEQLAEIRKAASEVTNKALQDWLDGETDYYDAMMGNTTALGKTLSEISKHYDNAIAEAKAAGATEEQLAELRKAASEVAQKAIQDEYDSLVAYYNDLMGIGTDLEASIADVTAKFVEYAKALLAINPNADLSGLATALQNIIDKLKDDYWDDYADKLNEYLGVSNDWMNQLKDMNDFFKEAYQNAGNDAALRDKILKDWANAIDYFGATLLADYQSQVNQWLGISETQEEAMQREIDSYFLMVYYFLSAMKAAPEVLQGIVDDYNKVTQRNKDTHGQMGSTGSTGSTGTTTTDDGFSDALSEFTNELESYVDELKSLVESIQNTIDDIKYSNLNPYLTTSSKLAMAQGDYQKLFAAAKTGTTDDVNKYLAFVSQYLESAQARYKSSTMYQQIYNQVMKDLGIIQGNTQTKLTKSEELLDKINANMVSSYSVLNDIKTILWNIQHGSTQSSYAGSVVDSYNPTVASITTGRNDSTAEDNRKIVNLLEGIYMAQSKPKRVEIRLDSGKTLTGEMMAVADSVYVERSSRPNMAQRRIYQ